LIHTMQIIKKITNNSLFYHQKIAQLLTQKNEY
jgi:hypothetical protein